MTLKRSYVYDFIHRHKLGVLSTVGAGGGPMSALLGIAVSPELELYFDTVASTRKVPNLRRDPRVAFVIGWDNEQTVQYEGIADEPNGQELAKLKDVYFAAWPECRDHESWSGITYYRVRPTWLRYSSFVGPPLIEEMIFPVTA